MKNKLLIPTFFLALIISGCKYCKGQVDGGSCSYSKEIYPAKVIAIFEMDSLYSDVYFLLNDSINHNSDTLSYSSEFGGYINSDTLQKMNIKIGDLFKYEIKDIQTGHCSPHLERLLLEKYEK